MDLMIQPDLQAPSVQGLLEYTTDALNHFWRTIRSVYEIQETMMSKYWDKKGSELGVKIVPYYPLRENDLPRCGVVLSSRGTTAEYEIYIGKMFGKVDYKLLITDNEKSGAKNIYEKMNKEFSESPTQLVDLDYREWKTERGIKGTRIFDFKGEKPDICEIRRRIQVREGFTSDLGELIFEAVPEGLDTLSMRGGELIMTHNAGYLAKTIDNTHPARMDVRYADGRGVFAGWQLAAIDLAKKHGMTDAAASLIDVPVLPPSEEIQTHEDVEKHVDSGTLVAMSPSLPQYNKGLDAFLILLKASGFLPAVCGVTEKPIEVRYIKPDGRPIMIEKKAIVVGDTVRSGMYPFGIDSLNDIHNVTKLIG